MSYNELLGLFFFMINLIYRNCPHHYRLSNKQIAFAYHVLFVFILSTINNTELCVKRIQISNINTISMYTSSVHKQIKIVKIKRIRSNVRNLHKTFIQRNFICYCYFSEPFQPFWKHSILFTNIDTFAGKYSMRLV